MNLNKKNIFFNIFILLIVFKNILNDEIEGPIFVQKDYTNDNKPLTRIIRISDEDYRFINIASNLKGDLFIETSPISESSERIFYGLKNNGRPFFINKESNEETPFYIMNEMTCNLKRHESELINVVLNNEDNTEYLMSISVEGSVEIYDFENGIRKYISTETFLGFSILSLINYSILLKTSNIYYIIFPIYCYFNDPNFGESYYLYLKKYNFVSLDISNLYSYTSELSTPYFASDSKMISCFTTQSLKILCFFRHNSNYFSINAFYYDFTYINYWNLIDASTIGSYTFFKAIHLKEEIIALYYYIDDYIGFGHLSLRQLIVSDDEKSIDALNNFEDIIINRVSLYTQLYFNDFIKLNDNKLCIISLINYKKFYIITATLFNNNENIIIYYYSIEMINSYNFNGEMKLNNFNNFLVFCSSLCSGDSCGISSTIFSTLIIFSYPNCTDTNIDLVQYLLNNNIYINDFEINLTNYFIIENNIFGYIFKSIKITNVFEDVNLKIIKQKDNTELTNDYELGENELLKIYFDKTELSKGEYKIEYKGVVTEPNFNIFILYPEFNDTTYQQNNDYSHNFEKLEYYGKTAYYIINITNDLTSDCLNNCRLCYKNSVCICKNEDNSDNNDNSDKNDNSDNNDNSNNYCTLDNIMNNKCKDIINDEQIKELYIKVKEILLNRNNNIIIETKNTAFQVAYYDNQTSNNKISYIDIGICEERIRKKYDIPDSDSLIIYKTDIKSEDLSSTYVQYEIYEPKSLTKINLDICEDIPVTIISPINLDPKVVELYDNLKQYGYNFFDSNDTFYNDICSRYTTEDGTDMTLTDRKELLKEESNTTLCQENCVFINFDSSTNRSNCSCQIQKKNTTLETKNLLFSKNILVQSFYVTFANSNFKVMKCYKLLFSKDGQINNIGSYILISIIIIVIFLMILCFLYGNKKIKYFIQIIIKAKFDKKIIKENNNKDNNINELDSKIKLKINDQENNITNSKNVKNKKKEPPRKKKSTKEFEENSLNSRLNLKRNKTNYSSKKVSKLNLKIYKMKNNKTSTIKLVDNDKKTNYNSKTLKYKKNKKKKSIDIKINDYEMNNLDYDKAKIIDKRDFLPIYWSILKQNQLIMFAFLPNIDFNLTTIKISLALISLSLYFTINCFFFDDESMHKIYIELGKYKFINQLPKTIYSCFISSTINFLLRITSLSGKNILLIKKQNTLESALIKAKAIEKCERIKMVIFYSLSFLFLIFFWYLISCFCAVYVNTQVILIYDTLISFLISMLYPFGYCLIPSILRLISFKSNKKILYNLSLILT